MKRLGFTIGSVIFILYFVLCVFLRDLDCKDFASGIHLVSAWKCCLVDIFGKTRFNYGKSFSFSAVFQIPN